MANSKTAIQIPEDEEEDIEFLCQLEAAEALALSSASIKRRRISVDAHVKMKREKEEFVEEIEEGAYTAALKGSKSLTWKKHQQSSLTPKPSDSVTTVGGGGGACFRCGKDGHWARDCPQSTSFAENVGSTAPPSTMVAGEEKACPCGSGNCLLLTANTERNRGRKFFRCPLRQESGGCGFFEWCDASSGSGNSAEERAWKNGGQQQYYQRPANQAATAYTNSWNEFDRGISTPTSSYRAAEKFECTDSKGYGVGNGSSCFKCGQEGHWARDCSMTTPNNKATAAVRFKSSSDTCYKFESTDSYRSAEQFESTDSKRYGMGNGSSCFKCGQEGHWARDCSMTAPKNNATASVRLNSSSDTCYKCGQSGHWARDCSQAQSTKVRNW